MITLSFGRTAALKLRRVAMFVTLCTASLIVPGGCDGGGAPSGEPVLVRIPPGATLSAVADTLAAYDIVESADRFTLYVRVRGDAERLQAGAYSFQPGAEWGEIAAALTSGRVFTERFTIPEGFTRAQIIERVAAQTETEATAVRLIIDAEDAPTRWRVPGPTLEGYLFPETYTITPGIGIEEVVGVMIQQYRTFWTPERTALRDSLGMTELELVTLASIVQAEARRSDELPTIASVYHNRLRIGMPLQADPTVIYALGGPRERLLFAAMDSVADSPYNTYTHPGLPPGPIASPGAAALDATLRPAETEYLYFVAHPDGHHLFSRSLAEHNQTRQTTDRLWAEARAETARREAFVRDSLAAARADTTAGVDTIAEPTDMPGPSSNRRNPPSRR